MFCLPKSDHEGRCPCTPPETEFLDFPQKRKHPFGCFLFVFHFLSLRELRCSSGLSLRTEIFQKEKFRVCADALPLPKKILRLFSGSLFPLLVAHSLKKKNRNKSCFPFFISSRTEVRDELSSSRTSFFPLHEGLS